MLLLTFVLRVFFPFYSTVIFLKDINGSQVTSLLSEQFLLDKIYGCLVIRYLSKRNTIRHLQLTSFFHWIFFCLVETKLLPLCIDRMDRPARKNTLFKNPLPVMWVFISLVRILKHHIKYLDDLSDCEFGPRERHFLPFVSNYELDKVLWQ